ncbi:MAG: hypothetical protein EFT35_08455 [Methanophagales archaeon ANME-1-THS]|nr:MAG: hypothetical protein EFT35_08455 [Methanophagales archaeon ANME-1-THS]
MASTAKFWRDQESRYNLEGTHCSKCGRFFFPPRPVCPTCRMTHFLKKGCWEAHVLPLDYCRLILSLELLKV